MKHIRLFESFINETIKFSDNTPVGVKSSAQKEFGDLLPKGYYFTIGTTPSGRKRLQLKDGNKKLVFEFSPGIKNGIATPKELTKELVLHALNWNKNNENESNEFSEELKALTDYLDSQKITYKVNKSTDSSEDDAVMLDGKFYFQITEGDPNPYALWNDMKMLGDYKLPKVAVEMYKIEKNRK